MSKDVQFFNMCNHIVDNKYYDLYACPRCYGKSYYIDICFDNAGEAILAQGDIKLQQEILKIIIDKKYDNPFHPDWGCEKDLVIGTKNVQLTKVKLEKIIRDALNYLKNVQSTEYEMYKTLTQNEILGQIDFIQIIPLQFDRYQINISILNTVNEVITQEFII